MARNLLLLGSTGSIGRQTLEVARSLGERVRIYGLAAGGNAALLAEQAAEFRPHALCLEEPLHGGLKEHCSDLLYGDVGMVELARRPEVDLVVVATSGKSGLLPTLAALTAGKRVALANKETLVMAGPLIRETLASGGGELVPIDSEHSAIWQCLIGEAPNTIERLTLTASGGALRSLTRAELATVTPEQALRHPTWSMGRKITIDSANLMNKGLEVLEAQWLFDIPLSHIDVVMHPQSIVHSLVSFSDSSTKAQLGLPDMRLPIQYALSHPLRWPNDLSRLDLTAIGALTFGAVDWARYPALRLALDAGAAGGTCPAVLSAADEVAVEAFLGGRLAFTAIPDIIAGTLDRHSHCGSPSLGDILESDQWARATAAGLVAAL